MSVLPSGAGAPTIVLRRWQAACVPLIGENIAAGGQGVVSAFTGTGKSITMTEAIRHYLIANRDSVDKIVISAPSKRLVNQLADTLSTFLGAHNVGRYFTDAKQWERRIIVCCNASAVGLNAVLKANGHIVSLWIVDECHKAEGEQFIVEGEEEVEGAPVVDVFNAVCRIGFTATAFRSSETESLTLWKSIIYVHTPADALRDGDIVPWRVIGWDETREQTDPDEVCAIMIHELGDRQTRGPGVVNATTIADAESYCTFLATKGLVAKPIHSKQREADQKANIELLRTGQIDCLVHVSMLVEGVDFPWLRWGCLRRAVGARIRFIQEVGRFIRACPAVGKTEAVLLDPNDLFGTFQLNYESALGWAEEKGDPVVRQEQKDIEASEGKPAKERRAVRTSALARYVRQLLISLLAEGKVVSGKAYGSASAGWRSEEPSKEQLRLCKGLYRKAANKIANPYGAALTAILFQEGVPTRGIVSDAITLLQGVASYPTEWAPAAPVAAPPPSAFEVVPLPPDPTWYCAGGTRGGYSAATVVHHGELKLNDKRAHEPGDTWASLTLYAVAKAVRMGAAEVAVGDADAVAMLNGTKLPTKKAETYLRFIPDTVRVEHKKDGNPAIGKVWKVLPRPNPAPQQ